MRTSSTLWAAVAALGCAASAHAATVTPILKYDFNGTLSTTTYTAAGGEIGGNMDVMNSANPPTLTGGVLTLDGQALAGPGNDQGLRKMVSGNFSNNYVFEAWIDPNESVIGGGNAANLGTVFGNQWGGGPPNDGVRWYLRFAGGGTLEAEVQPRNSGAFGSNNGVKRTVAWSGALTTGLQHVAVVYTANTIADNQNTLTQQIYINGVAAGAPLVYGNFVSSEGTPASPDLSGLDFTVIDFFEAQQFNNNRGFTGTSDGIAWSSFTGVFNPATDFVIIPEPASLVLAGVGLALIGVRRRRA